MDVLLGAPNRRSRGPTRQSGSPLGPTLRHRPDRIIVGELRGGEAFDLLQALNTGHAGSLSTIHANSGEQGWRGLRRASSRAGLRLPYQAVRYQIADAIDVELHLERRRGMRVVEELITVGRYDAASIGIPRAAGTTCS